MAPRLRMGMLGGAGGFIGAVHRMAACLDNQIELVSGVFSSNPDRSRDAGAAFYLRPERVYASYQEMLAVEAALPSAERLDFVTVATPNYLHSDMATAAMMAGFHVLCEKPMTTTLDSAKALAAQVRRSQRLFCLMHNYSGYPMVKEARARVQAGQLGDIRKIVVEYPQGWLAGNFASAGVRQKTWKVVPELAGDSCCVGDIGTHAFHLAEYVTGLRVTELCADLSVFVKTKDLEDDANLLLRFDNGARGVLYASQISINDENSLCLRVYGSRAGLEWHQEEPNTLLIKWPDRPREIVRTGRGNAYLLPPTLAATRLPAGHPEGFIEGFANVYREFGAALRRVQDGATVAEAAGDYPTVDDGVRGVAFIRAAVRSHATASKWTPLVV